jgi:hypothetical protein
MVRHGQQLPKNADKGKVFFNGYFVQPGSDSIYCWSVEGKYTAKNSSNSMDIIQGLYGPVAE